MKIKEINNIELLKVFEIENDYIIEVFFDKDKKVIEAYLYNKSYGVKSLLFGCCKSDKEFNNMPMGEFLESFCDTVLSSVENDIEDYRETYED